MKRNSPWLSWLVWAAVADWLLARTLARSAIFMPKSPAVLAIYQVTTTLGQVAGVLSALLALLGVVWLAWRRRKQAGGALSLALVGLAGLSLIFLVTQPAGGLHLLYQVLLLGAIGSLGWQTWVRMEAKNRLALIIPWMALWAAGLYQAIQVLYTAAHWSGPPPLTGILFNAGELFAVLTPLALWWGYGRTAARRSYYLWALLPAAGFVGMVLAAPPMAGILSIWSTGLTLYLPWPLYAAALWLGCVTLLSSRRTGSPAAAALLLLAAGGYTPGLSSQAFLGLIALDVLNPEEVISLRLGPADLSSWVPGYR